MFGIGLTATQVLGGIMLLLLLGWLVFCCVVMLNVSRARRAEARKATQAVELSPVAVSMAIARPEE